MKPRCDICNGRQIITLPVRVPLSATAFDPNHLEKMAPLEVRSRDYPCPECSEIVPLERVRALSEHTHVALYIDDPEFVRHVQESLTHQLADHLLRHGYIEFERGPNDDQQMRFAMRATVGVVSKRHPATLEQRIAERQIEVAQEVAVEAKQQIDNWGSLYGHADILKRDAIRLVGDAIKVVLAKRSAWKPMGKPRLK